MAQKNFAIIAGVGAAAMLVLIVGFLMVVAKMRKKKRDGRGSSPPQHSKPPRPTQAPTVADAQKNLEARMAGQVGEQARKDAEAMLQLKLPEVHDQEDRSDQETYRRRSQEGSHRDGAGSEDVAQW